MSKYNKLPAVIENNSEPCHDDSMPISKLCCLPILMDKSQAYRNYISNLLPFEELLPDSQRLQIRQMLYMDSLLENLRSFSSEVNIERNRDEYEVIENLDSSGSVTQFIDIAKQVSEYNKSKDLSLLLSIFGQKNPMLSMIMPMLSSKNRASSGSQDMISALLPMLMTGGATNNSSLLSSLMGII